MELSGVKKCYSRLGKSSEKLSTGVFSTLMLFESAELLKNYQQEYSRL